MAWGAGNCQLFFASIEAAISVLVPFALHFIDGCAVIFSFNNLFKRLLSCGGLDIVIGVAPVFCHQIGSFAGAMDTIIASLMPCDPRLADNHMGFLSARLFLGFR